MPLQQYNGLPAEKTAAFIRKKGVAQFSVWRGFRVQKVYMRFFFGK
jgi:hypothetical protein